MYGIHCKNNKTYIILMISYPIITYVISIMTIYINKSFNKNMDINYVYALYNPLGTIGAISTFLFFKNLKIKKSYAINNIAKTSLGVYLFSEHSYYKQILWTIDFKSAEFFSVNPIIFIIYIFLSAIIVYGIGYLIELFRINVFEKPLFNIKSLNKLFNKYDNWINQKSENKML